MHDLALVLAKMGLSKKTIKEEAFTENLCANEMSLFLSYGLGTVLITFTV
jgi:hypothetical protein